MTNLGTMPIEELAMDFAIGTARDKLATFHEIQAQLDRYKMLTIRIGNDEADKAIANAKNILTMIGLKPTSGH